MNRVHKATEGGKAARMKVTRLETLVVENVPPYRGGQEWLLIRLHTDDGIVGLGERPAMAARDLRPHVALLEDLCEAFVIGQDPFQVERIWQQMYGVRHDFRHPSLYATPALSAIEIALWDIVGKAVNQPIYNLLGGRFHDRLKAYAYMPSSEEAIKTPAIAGEVAARLVAEGWTTTKIDPFLPAFPYPQQWPLPDIVKASLIFRAIREAVGDELEVGIGTHGQFTTSSAIRVAKVFEPYFPAWFEEPVPPEKPEEMARVAAQTTIPIATGERLSTKFEFSSLLEMGGAGIIQLDVGQCGGILEAKKISAIAEAHHAATAPHMYCGPIATAAAVQLDTCSPSFMIQEFNVGPLHEEILVEPIRVEKGYITPPTGAGLGVELNESVLQRQLVRKSTV